MLNETMARVITELKTHPAAGKADIQALRRRLRRRQARRRSTIASVTAGIFMIGGLVLWGEAQRLRSQPGESSATKVTFVWIRAGLTIESAAASEIPDALAQPPLDITDPNTCEPTGGEPTSVLGTVTTSGGTDLALGSHVWAVVCNAQAQVGYGSTTIAPALPGSGDFVRVFDAVSGKELTSFRDNAAIIIDPKSRFGREDIAGQWILNAISFPGASAPVVRDDTRLVIRLGSGLQDHVEWVPSDPCRGYVAFDYTLSHHRLVADEVIPSPDPGCGPNELASALVRLLNNQPTATIAQGELALTDGRISLTARRAAADVTPAQTFPPLPAPSTPTEVGPGTSPPPFTPSNPSG